MRREIYKKVSRFKGLPIGIAARVRPHQAPVRLFCEEGRHFPAGAPLAAALPCNDSCIHCAAACRVRRLQPARCITNAYLWLQY